MNGSEWRIEVTPEYERAVRRDLDLYQQEILDAAVRGVLAMEDTAVCASEWGKPLGERLYEFRVQKKSKRQLMQRVDPAYEPLPGDDRRVTLRVFFTTRGRRLILLLSAYDKGADPSRKKQQTVIREGALHSGTRSAPEMSHRAVMAQRLPWSIQRDIIGMATTEVADMGRSYGEFSRDLQQSWTAEAHQDTTAMAAGARAIYEDDLRKQMGRALKTLRTEQGLRQVDVAERAGVRQTDVSAIERGLGNPTTRTLFAVASALRARVRIVDDNGGESLTQARRADSGTTATVDAG